MLVYKSMSTDVSFAPLNPSLSPATPPLPDDVATLHAMIVELLEALQQSQHECAGLQQRLEQLLRRLYGPKAERFDPNQPWLLPELAGAAEPAKASPILRFTPQLFAHQHPAAVRHALLLVLQ